MKASFSALPGAAKEDKPGNGSAQLTMDVQAVAPTAASTPREEPAEPHAELPRPRSSSTVVAFGPYKGKTASELSDEELSETIELAHEKLMEQPRARWAKAMRENLAALEAETELRCRVPSAANKEASAEA